MFLNNFPGVWRKVSADVFCNSQAQTDHGRRGTEDQPDTIDGYVIYGRLGAMDSNHNGRQTRVSGNLLGTPRPPPALYQIVQVA